MDALQTLGLGMAAHALQVLTGLPQTPTICSEVKKVGDCHVRIGQRTLWLEEGIVFDCTIPGVEGEYIIEARMTKVLDSQPAAYHPSRIEVYGPGFKQGNDDDVAYIGYRSNKPCMHGNLQSCERVADDHEWSFYMDNTLPPEVTAQYRSSPPIAAETGITA